MDDLVTDIANILCEVVHATKSAPKALREINTLIHKLMVRLKTKYFKAEIGGGVYEDDIDEQITFLEESVRQMKGLFEKKDKVIEDVKFIANHFLIPTFSAETDAALTQLIGDEECDSENADKWSLLHPEDEEEDDDLDNLEEDEDEKKEDHLEYLEEDLDDIEQDEEDDQYAEDEIIGHVEPLAPPMPSLGQGGFLSAPPHSGQDWTGA